MRISRSILAASERYFVSITFCSIATVSALSLYGLFVAWLYRVENAFPSQNSPTISSSSFPVDTAWSDLIEITLRPHFFNSREHERVRQYLLSRISSIAASSPLAEHIDIISDELGFVVAYDSRTGYWEGENIYAVIHGRSSAPGVLVSAHYDSVASAFGASDDGVGIVTLLQLFHHFSVNRPEHDVVLNFNTGEEINLYGSYQFVKHPIAANVTYFLNLEGAGGGGRTAMFRGSNYEALKAFAASAPALGNVIMQDMFKMRVINSDTDFSTYDDAGLSGLDLAFYKPRSRYHTTLDNVKSTDKRSVQYMLDAALQITTSLAVDGVSITDANRDKAGIFFDIHGKFAFAYSMFSFACVSLLFVILGPILIAFIIYYSMFKYPVLKFSSSGWFRTPILLFLLIVVNLIAANSIISYNPGIIYSSDLPLLTIIFFSLVTSFITLAVAEFVRPTVTQLPCILELLMLHWLLAAISTFLQITLSLGGGFVFVFQYIGTLAATIVSFSPYLLEAKRLALHQSETEAATSILTDTAPREDAQDEGDALLVTSAPKIRYEPLVLDDGIQASLEFLEFTFAALLPTGQLISLAFFSINSLRYGAADGAPTFLRKFSCAFKIDEVKHTDCRIAYANFSACVVSILVTLSPLISRFVRLRDLFSVPMCSLAFITGLVLFSASLRTFPYNEIAPLKVFLDQEIDYTIANSGHWFDGGRVNVVGLKDYVPQIISHM